VESNISQAEGTIGKVHKRKRDDLQKRLDESALPRRKKRACNGRYGMRLATNKESSSKISNRRSRDRQNHSSRKVESVRRKFESDWDEIRYLYRKVLYWVYDQGDRRRAARFGNRLRRLLRRQVFHNSIFAEECRSLIDEVNEKLDSAIQHRENEIRLIRKLWRSGKLNPLPESVLDKYKPADLSDRLDLLAILYDSAGRTDEAVGVLKESKALCKKYKIPFDGADMLAELTAADPPDRCHGTFQAKFDRISEALWYVLHRLVRCGHKYIISVRGPQEVEKSHAATIQIVPQDFVYSDAGLGFTVHMPFDPDSSTFDDLSRFLKMQGHDLFDEYQFQGIRCFVMTFGFKIDLATRVVSHLLNHVYGYPTGTSFICEVIDEGPMMAHKNGKLKT
jgi:hypothetical protein